MQIKFVSNASSTSPGRFRKLAGMIGTVAIVTVAMMFSAVLLVVLFVLGAIAAAYLWWKSRKLRRDFPLQGMAQQATASDDVYEGEVIRVVEPQDVR